jgi:hypothetical protein
MKWKWITTSLYSWGLLQRQDRITEIGNAIAQTEAIVTGVYHS